MLVTKVMRAVGEQMNDNKNKYKIENTTYHSATEKQRDKWRRSMTIFEHMLLIDSQDIGDSHI